MLIVASTQQRITHHQVTRLDPLHTASRRVRFSLRYNFTPIRRRSFDRGRSCSCRIALCRTPYAVCPQSQPPSFAGPTRTYAPPTVDTRVHTTLDATRQSDQAPHLRYRRSVAQVPRAGAPTYLYRSSTPIGAPRISRHTDIGSQLAGHSALCSCRYASTHRANLGGTKSEKARSSSAIPRSKPLQLAIRAIRILPPRAIPPPATAPERCRTLRRSQTTCTGLELVQWPDSPFRARRIPIGPWMPLISHCTSQDVRCVTLPTTADTLDVRGDSSRHREQSLHSTSPCMLPHITRR
ncbi:hypothetical protein FKP32DRAFT_1237197 [Trametes sanguinea]|nr:hypothetical protein FKP32DRAFT_1237197 [Trametes sanguinea]